MALTHNGDSEIEEKKTRHQWTIEFWNSITHKTVNVDLHKKHQLYPDHIGPEKKRNEHAQEIKDKFTDRKSINWL